MELKALITAAYQETILICMSTTSLTLVDTGSGTGGLQR